VTDEALMAQFCAGDARAFDTRFSRHAAAVRRYLTRVTGSQAAADDLVQATFLSVVKARARFLPGARFKSWLYAIATNAARDAHRRTRGETLTDDGAVPEGVTDEPTLRDPGLEKQVRLALAKLPDAQREAVVLHRFEGLSFAEIAEAAGVTESAVKVRAHRGYEALRALLQGVWEP
jgi:RNA polymerase sigma-70 factor (ECF subfamily)